MACIVLDFGSRKIHNSTANIDFRYSLGQNKFATGFRTLSVARRFD